MKDFKKSLYLLGSPSANQSILESCQRKIVSIRWVKNYFPSKIL